MIGKLSARPSCASAAPLEKTKTKKTAETLSLNVRLRKAGDHNRKA
jgi:hypothetical protein